MKRHTGWIKSKEDKRDKIVKVLMRGILPDSSDLRIVMPKKHFDQGDSSSCTGQGSGGAIKFSYLKAGDNKTNASRLMLYFNGRENKNEDEGAQIRDVIKGAAKYGACDETLWPFTDDPKRIVTRPSDSCYLDGEKRQVTSYARVRQNLYDLKATLLVYPIVFGMTLYKSFETINENGKVPVPDTDKEEMLGGHCMLLVGYFPGYFIVRNSWGDNWGDGGDCYVPEEIILSSLCSDFWVIKAVEDEDTLVKLTDPTLKAKWNSFKNWIKGIF